MADLIDRQAVIDLLKKNTTRDIEEVVVAEKNIKLIMDMPKAYDVDAVIDKLEEELELAEKQKRECVFKALPYYDRTEGYIVATNNAISIVKAGGVE